MSVRDYLVKAQAEAAETRRAASRAEYAAKRAVEVYDTAEPAPAPTPAPTPSPAPAPAPAPAPTPTPTATRIVCTGDSITNWGKEWPNGSAITQKFEAAHPGIFVETVAGAGAQLGKPADRGTGANTLWGRFDQVLALNATHVPILIGSNDLGWWNFDMDTWLPGLWEHCAAYEALGIKVAIGTIPPQCDKPTINERAIIANEAIRASKYRVLDYAPLFPDPCDKTLLADGLHPAWDGFLLMQDVFKSGMEGWLAAPVPSDPRPADWLKTADVPIKPLDPALEAEWIHERPGHKDWDNVPDVVGAFRMIGNVTHLDQDDPLLFPGVPGGAGHWHQHFTTEGGPLNASNYWLHPLMDDLGRIKPFGHASLYYKRYPDFGDTIPQSLRDAYGDKWDANIQSHHSNHGPMHGIPRGLRMVFGWGKQKWTARRGDWNGTPIADASGQTLFSDLTWLREQLQPGDVLYMQMAAPSFWDGAHSGSPDHMMHVSYTQSDKHPIRMPTLSLIPGYLVTAEDRPATWRLSCDGPTDAPGSTAHGSYIEDWPEGIRLEWEQNAIDRMLNCSGGDLGSGRQLKRPANYNLTGQPALVTPTGTGRIDL